MRMTSLGWFAVVIVSSTRASHRTAAVSAVAVATPSPSSDPVTLEPVLAVLVAVHTTYGEVDHVQTLTPHEQVVRWTTPIVTTDLIVVTVSHRMPGPFPTPPTGMPVSRTPGVVSAPVTVDGDRVPRTMDTFHAHRPSGTAITWVPSPHPLRPGCPSTAVPRGLC